MLNDKIKQQFLDSLDSKPMAKVAYERNFGMFSVKVKKLHPDAIIPYPVNDDAAGYELCALDDGSIYGGDTAIIKTGLAFEIPFGYKGIIQQKSGRSLKNGIILGGGLIDSDYRGEVGIIVHNFSGHIFEYKKGEKIAQFMIELDLKTKFIEVQELNATERGYGGYGSTGLQSADAVAKMQQSNTKPLCILEESNLKGEIFEKYYTPPILEVIPEFKFPMQSSPPDLGPMKDDLETKIAQLAKVMCQSVEWVKEKLGLNDPKHNAFKETIHRTASQSEFEEQMLQTYGKPGETFEQLEERTLAGIDYANGIVESIQSKDVIRTPPEIQDLEHDTEGH